MNKGDGETAASGYIRRGGSPGQVPDASWRLRLARHIRDAPTLHCEMQLSATN